MERMKYRSTSLVDLQAELHEQDLLREAIRSQPVRTPRPRSRAARFGLRLLGRRLSA